MTNNADEKRAEDREQLSNRERAEKIADLWLPPKPDNVERILDRESLKVVIEQALNEVEQKAFRAGAEKMREDVAVFLEADGWNDSFTTVNQKDQAFRYARVILGLPLPEDNKVS